MKHGVEKRKGSVPTLIKKEPSWFRKFFKLSGDIWQSGYGGVTYRAKFVGNKRISEWHTAEGVTVMEESGYLVIATDALDEAVRMHLTVPNVEAVNVEDKEKAIQRKRAIVSLWEVDEVERTLEKIGDL